MKHLMILAIGLVFSFAHAEGIPGITKASPKHLGTRAQQLRAKQWNKSHPSLKTQDTVANWPVLKPFSEIETSGYVAISSDDSFEMPDLRLAIAKNLPADVTLVIYVGDASEVPALKQLYAQYLGADRLKFVVTPMSGDSDPVWARDSLPFPVHMGAASSSPFGLVASIYPQDFDPNAPFAKALSLPMQQTGQVFRGGNLLLDMSGNCFAENVNEVASLSDPQGFFTNYFGCASVTLLDQQGGIGDLDERLKFTTGKDVLTDNATYAALLKGKGYTVHMIPETGDDMETYMNTLYVNGTMFVPQMGIPADQDALVAYRALGFNAVGVNTKQLADQGEGNIHCVTMNYPPGSFTASLEGADFVKFAGR